LDEVIVVAGVVIILSSFKGSVSFILVELNSDALFILISFSDGE
jgi:hypothetical protein